MCEGNGNTTTLLFSWKEKFYTIEMEYFKGILFHKFGPAYNQSEQCQAEGWSNLESILVPASLAYGTTEAVYSSRHFINVEQYFTSGLKKECERHPIVPRSVVYISLLSLNRVEPRPPQTQYRELPISSGTKNFLCLKGCDFECKKYTRILFFTCIFFPYNWMQSLPTFNSKDGLDVIYLFHQ